MPVREKTPFHAGSGPVFGSLTTHAAPLQAVALSLHHLDDLVHIVPTGIQIRRFHHHPDHRLGAGLAQQNPSLAAQAFRHLRHLGLNGSVVLGRLFVLDPDIFRTWG